MDSIHSFTHKPARIVCGFKRIAWYSHLSHMTHTHTHAAVWQLNLHLISLPPSLCPSSTVWLATFFYSSGRFRQQLDLHPQIWILHCRLLLKEACEMLHEAEAEFILVAPQMSVFLFMRPWCPTHLLEHLTIGPIQHTPQYQTLASNLSTPLVSHGP